MTAEDVWGGGFLQVPRDPIEQLIGSERTHATVIVLLELLVRRRWSNAGRRVTSRGVLDLEVDQLVIGERELAAKLGLHRNVIRTALGRLEALGVLTCDSGPNGTLITIRARQSTVRPQISRSTSGPSSGPPSGPHVYDDEQGSQDHTQDHSADHTGTTSGPHRDPNVDPDQRYAIGRSGGGASPSPEPSAIGRAEQERRVNYFLRRINAARVDVAAAHRLGRVWPITLMDDGGRGERELRARLANSADPGPDQALEHVLDIAIAEAHESGKLKWLSWSVAEPKAWRAKLAASLAEVTAKRAGPRRTGDAIGAASPRTDHPVSATLIPCSEL